jgi:hypothetical protein
VKIDGEVWEQAIVKKGSKLRGSYNTERGFLRFGGLIREEN